MTTRHLLICRLFFALAFATLAMPALGDDPASKPQHRQPISLAFVDACKQLLVANAASGSVSVIDLADRAVVGETLIGNRRFNPPSLRGLSHRRAFFHDGRAKELADVFSTHGHQLDDALRESELNDLLAFLRSL